MLMQFLLGICIMGFVLFTVTLIVDEQFRMEYVALLIIWIISMLLYKVIMLIVNLL